MPAGAYGPMEPSEPLAGVSWRSSAVQDIDPEPAIRGTRSGRTNGRSPRGSVYETTVNTVGYVCLTDRIGRVL